jgi:hypothetical protein
VSFCWNKTSNFAKRSPLLFGEIIAGSTRPSFLETKSLKVAPEEPKHYGEAKKTKTYNSGYSLVVTHLTTNPPVRCLNRAERTGSLVFNVLWSYVKILAKFIANIANSNGHGSGCGSSALSRILRRQQTSSGLQLGISYLCSAAAHHKAGVLTDQQQPCVQVYFEPCTVIFGATEGDVSALTGSQIRCIACKNIPVP